MTDTDPLALLETLTGELIRAGWTRQPDPAASPGTVGATHRLLTSPDGTAQVHATAYRLNREVVSTLYGLDARAGERAPRWQAGTAAVAASVLIAAARAACEPSDRGVESRLREAGWQVTGREYEGARLIEQTWTSPGGERTASWFPPDLPFDTGGWIIIRPDQCTAHAQLDTTADTPDAVTAALALTP